MGDLAALLAGLDAGERVRGKGFERLCKWVLENDPEYAALLKRVWLWNDWPESGDQLGVGIDLVAETRGGDLWAIQAKHYGSENSLPWDEISSFVAASGTSRFSYRLLMATTDQLTANARRELAKQERIGWLLRSQLEALDLDWPLSVSAPQPSRPEPKTPLPHQLPAIRDCVSGLSEADRGQLVMACGTGKTLVARFLHDELGVRLTLVLVPSLSLMKQTIREWFTVGDFDYLAVCSDDSVAKEDRDAVVGSTSELGVPVTTDPSDITAFLRGSGSRPRVVFATYQSSQRIADAQAVGAPMFDLAVADEAHRCAGPTAGAFATVLDATKIRARKRLFMTATPRWVTDRVKEAAREKDWEIASMDDEAQFGKVLHRLRFKQAIDDDLLSDYRVVVVGVSDSECHEMAERGAIVTLDGESVTDARTLARQIGLLRTMEKYDLCRVVTFHSRINLASRFADTLHDTLSWLPEERRPSGVLWTGHVSGKMNAGLRHSRLQRLRGVRDGERGVLTNARCLSEGVDVPTLDGVAFIDPRRSQVDIVQAVGRVMRKADDKTVGTIIIPVFVDENADPEQELASREFDSVWQVVKALRAHDDELVLQLDQLRIDLGRGGSLGERPARIHFDVPVSVGTRFARAFDSWLVARATTGWQEGLGAAQAYYERHRHLRPKTTDVTPEGFRLGWWLAYQRVYKDELGEKRIAELTALEMRWDLHEDSWEDWIIAARAYREENGDLLVPTKHLTPDRRKLGKWIDSQRSAKKKGSPWLAPERIEELTRLGMVWDVKAYEWQLRIAAARAYHEENGDLLVPPDCVIDGVNLGRWIRNWRKHKEQLTPEQIADLDALDMDWTIPLTPKELWERGISEAHAYRQTRPDLLVPTSFVTDDGFPLGRWMANKRNERKRNVLSQERIAQLDALGVWERQKET